MTVAELVKKAKRHKNKTVTVRGPLHHGGAMCTEIACNEECCNTCTSPLVLGEADPEFEAAFLLRAGAGAQQGGTADRYDCSGDESMVCCVHEASGQDVIVTGTLTHPTDVTPPDTRLRIIVDATICAPKATATDPAGR
jgi:hypothetical protein